MTLSRKQYYFFLLTACLSPVILFKIGWLTISRPIVGTVISIGRTRGRETGRQTFPVVEFVIEKKTFTTYGDYNLEYQPGDQYPIRYNRFNKSDTRLNTFWGCWIDTVIWTTIFTVIITIVFLVDGIVPNSKLVHLSLKGIDFID